MNRRSLLLAPLLLAVTLLLTACPAGTPGVPATGVTITAPGSTSLSIGATLDLDATVTPTGASQSVTWSSSDDAVATVDGNGVVTGVSAGPVTITATSAANTALSDDIDLTVTAPGVSCATPTELTSALATGTLPLDCYFVADNAVVDVTSALTLLPGTVLEFGAGARLDVESGGTLTADGTAASMIVFRGSSNTKGYWDGIYINANSDNLFDYVEIHDGGDAGYANLYLTSNGAVSVTNSTISNGEGYGIELTSSAADIRAFSGNTFSGNDTTMRVFPNDLGALDDAGDYDGSSATANANNYIHVSGGSTGTGPFTWPATDAPFQVVASSVVDVTGVVTLAPGLVMQFEAGARMDIEAGGTLTADGTAASMIVFRGSSNTKGYWDGIYINANSDNLFDFVEIHDGGDAGYANLYLTSNGAVSVTNSTISNGEGYGIELTSSAADMRAFSGNTFSGNDITMRMFPNDLGALDDASDYDGSSATANANNYIHVSGGSTGTGPFTWPATDAPFQVVASSVVDVTGVVTLDPGAVLRFEGGARLDIETGGVVNADADGASRIEFISSAATPLAGDWDGIYINANSANLFRNVRISHAGDAGYAGVYITSNGAVTVTDSEISDNVVGIDLTSAAGSLSPADACTTANTFSGNGTDCDLP